MHDANKSLVKLALNVLNISFFGQDGINTRKCCVLLLLC